MNSVTTRLKEAARQAGHKHYVGRRCRTHGDDPLRYVSCGTCVQCVKESTARRVINGKHYAGGKIWVAKNPGKVKDKAARHRATPKYKANRAIWLAKNAVKVRENSTRNNRRRLGLPEPTRPMPTHCECCGGLPNGGRSLHLDHDHETGKFRGWLCDKCNRGIGMLGDTYEGIVKGYNYLARLAGIPEYPAERPHRQIDQHCRN